MPRYEMMYDGRRLPPRNARGEFMSRGRGRGRRGDRGMDYGYDMDMARGGQGGRGRGDRGDYGRSYDMAHQEMHPMDYRGGDYRGGQMSDRGGDYGDMRTGDGHYPQGQGSTYYPIQAMGTFEGYYGMPQEDYGRGRGRDYGYDMGGDYARGGRRDYGYDYGYDYAYGDFGESLSEKELKEWEHKLMSQLDEREKQMFRKEVIVPKFKQMGIEMKNFNEEELYVATLAKYTDHKASIGQNPDLAIKLARDFMIDPDSNVKGSERLAVYYDTFVED